MAISDIKMPDRPKGSGAFDKVTAGIGAAGTVVGGAEKLDKMIEGKPTLNSPADDTAMMRRFYVSKSGNANVSMPKM
jgi:hypothetical protein